MKLPFDNTRLRIMIYVILKELQISKQNGHKKGEKFQIYQPPTNATNQSYKRGTTDQLFEWLSELTNELPPPPPPPPFFSLLSLPKKRSSSRLCSNQVVKCVTFFFFVFPSIFHLFFFSFMFTSYLLYEKALAA